MPTHVWGGGGNRTADLSHEMTDQSCMTFAGRDELCVSEPINFSTMAAQNLLRKKRLVIMGCSVQRDLYKDIVLLLQEERFLSKYENRVKGSRTVVNDTLLKGGILEELKNDPSYREVREYKQGDFHVRFYFITRAYNPIGLGFIRNIYNEFHPDIFLFNSAIWDVNRNGPPFDSLAYEQNVKSVCQILTVLFSQTCRLIWLHQPPITPKCATGRIVLEANQELLKGKVMHYMYEAVCMAEQIAKSYNFETIDLYNLMKFKSHWIAKDGVHWASEGYRRMTLLILHKFSHMYNIPLPSDSVEYSYPTEISAEELNKVFDEDDNDVRYLYASKVDSLIDFTSEPAEKGEEKTLPQLLDQANFKKVVERNKLNDAVVRTESIDGSFRTEDEIRDQAIREEIESTNQTRRNPTNERLRNFFNSALPFHQRVTPSSSLRTNAYFKKEQTPTTPSNPAAVAPVIPSFFQTPEELQKLQSRTQQFSSSTVQIAAEEQSGSPSTSASSSSSSSQSSPQQVKRRIIEDGGPDVIEATEKKVVKVNRLAQLFG